MINAELEKTIIQYNDRFQTVKVTDANNQIYDFTHDPLGRMLSQTRAGTTQSYQYDEVGNKTKRTDNIGRITEYDYDNLNRLEQINYFTNDNGIQKLTYLFRLKFSKKQVRLVIH